MMRKVELVRLVVLFGVTLATFGSGAAALEAQSLFAGRGLGYVGEPLDARARGLGGIGLGLPEPSFSMMSPASVAGIPAPALHVTVQPDVFAATHQGVETSGQTVRFPLIHAVLPFRERAALSVGYASFLDRNWAVERDTTLAMGGVEVPVRDRFASHGGASRLRIGGAYGITDRIAVGAALDVYTGAARDTSYRVFFEGGLRPTVSASGLNFGGVGYSLGVRWNPGDALAVGAALSAGGRLRIEQDGAPQETRETVDLPVRLAVGASGRVTPTTLAALSATWDGWSRVSGEAAGAEAPRDTWTVAGGIEWEALRIGTQVVPLRIGGRSTALPYRWDVGADEGWANERALSAGSGLRLAGGAAILDGAVERGRRGGDAAGITESYWRFALSLTVLGR